MNIFYPSSLSTSICNKTLLQFIVIPISSLIFVEKINTPIQSRGNRHPPESWQEQKSRVFIHIVEEVSTEGEDTPEGTNNSQATPSALQSKEYFVPHIPK